MKKFYVNIDNMRKRKWIDFAQLESDPVKSSVGAGLDSSSSLLFSNTTLNTINTLDGEDNAHDTDFNICSILLQSVFRVLWLTANNSKKTPPPPISSPSKRIKNPLNFPHNWKTGLWGLTLWRSKCQSPQNFKEALSCDEGTEFHKSEVWHPMQSS